MTDQSGSFSAADIRAAMEEMRAQHFEVERETAERTAKFWDGVPERVRDHPFVQMLGHTIGHAIFHPNDARAVRAEYERICGLDDAALAADKAKAHDTLRQGLEGLIV